MGLSSLLQSVDQAVLVQAIASLVIFLLVVVTCLQVPPIMVWAERRAPAMMQRRKGPNRVGIGKFRLYGLLQSAADAVKLIFKEEIRPEGSNKVLYHIAPIFNVFPIFLIACAIPYGHAINIFGTTVSLAVINVNVGFLFILAVSSLAVYGVTLAGYAANNKYALLGSLRASAQMISYEIPLGLSLVPMVLIYGTLDLNEIVLQQQPVWGVVYAPISFVLFLICMFAETNRAPFDLAEGESELVAGFHTEYNSAKFAAIFLAEYVSMFILSLLAATVFFGGWQIPFVTHEMLTNWLWGQDWLATIIGVNVLFIKAAFFMFFYVWVRWTLPRFRYDQLMSLGWKFMLPIGLANVFITAIVIAALHF